MQTEAEVELPFKKEIEIQIKEVSPVESTPKPAQSYQLPPRDYDFETPPRDYIDGRALDGAKVIVDVDIEDKRSRKSSSSSSSSSESESMEDEQVKVEEPVLESADIVAESVDEVLEVGKPEIEVNEPEMAVVMPEIEQQIKMDKPDEKLEQPVIEVIANVDEATPVSVVIEDNVDKDINDVDVGVDKVDGVLPDVNPVQKPPRTYSDAAEVRHDINLRPYSVIENKPVEVIVERDEVAVEEPTVEEELDKVSYDIDVKRGENFDVMIKRDIIDEPEQQQPLDESLFKVLPESSVDSDSEVLADAENIMKEESPQLQKESPQLQEESPQTQVIHKDIPQRNPDATNTDAPSTDGIPLDSSTTEEEGDAEGDAKADRSSFLEAFSKNPTFGSWFSGDSTIVEQDKTEAQAEEIASQVLFKLDASHFVV